MATHIVTVEFKVEAEDQFDAESKLTYSLDHAHLINPTNGIAVVPNSIVFA